MRTRFIAHKRAKTPLKQRLAVCAGLWALSLLGAPASALPIDAYSKTPMTRVMRSPSSSSKELGYLAPAAKVTLSSLEQLSGAGCETGFVALEPVGYVCFSDLALDSKDEQLQKLQLLSPASGAYPFKYAISNGAPVYAEFPSAAVVSARERDLGAPGVFSPLRWQWRHERLAHPRGLAPSAAAEVFSGAFRKSANDFAPQGVMIAYRDVFAAHGRNWLYTSNGSVVPADRVRGYEQTNFRGIELVAGTSLPLAWTKKPIDLFVPASDGSMRAVTTVRERHALRLDDAAGDRSLKYQTKVFRRTRLVHNSDALYVMLDERVSVVEAVSRPSFVEPTEKWIWISTSRGVLVAYEGDTPTFSTLISPGYGGPSVAGRTHADNIARSTTPLGGFRIQHKHRVHTMSPDKPKPPREWTQWIEAVPFTQFFDLPFALHASYWQEDFGLPMSNGCVNLSPYDAAALFEWTLPQVPEGWGGVYQDKAHGAGTWVVVRR
jgi:lipoprotein-anchoring transpeptidase ErfK/SrfK